MDPAPYTVDLDVFHGPLDLLLYLIKRDELDIYDIPIARITDAFVHHVSLLQGMTHPGFDLGTAGDFLVVAATLMEIKSATLLPAPPATDDRGEPTAAAQLADPRYELVQQLLEYKRFKDAGSALEAQQRRHEARFPRWPAKPDQADADEPPPVDLDEVQVWDLLAAFDRLLRETGGRRRPRVHEVTYDDTPIDLHAADIEDRLGRDGKLTLRSLLVGRRTRSEQIGLFLALLELVREKRVLVTQDEPLGEVKIEVASEEHRRTYMGASLQLSNDG